MDTGMIKDAGPPPWLAPVDRTGTALAATIAVVVDWRGWAVLGAVNRVPSGRWPRAAALLAGVALWVLSAPPRSWWWCLPLGSLLTVVGLDGLRGRFRLLVLLVAGGAWAAGSLWWITEITAVGYLGAAVLLGVLMTTTLVVASGPGHAYRSGFRAPTTAGRWRGLVDAGAVVFRRHALLPVGLATLELVLARFPLQGFPLPALSLGQAAGPFALAAPLGGAPLVTLVSAAVGVELARALQTWWAWLSPQRGAETQDISSAGGAQGSRGERSGDRSCRRDQQLARLRKRTCRPLVVTLTPLVVLAAPLAAGAMVHTQPHGQLQVAVVQGGGPRGLRAVFSDPTLVTQRHLALAEALLSAAPANDAPAVDVVLLPENVLSVQGPVTDDAAQGRVARLAKDLGASVVVGVVETAPTTFRNAAVLWDAGGRIAGRYEKVHRVPFGEYLPWRGVLTGISSAGTLVPRDALIGKGPPALDVRARQGEVRVGVVISYEGFFAERVREAVQAGGQAVLLPTNSASYAYDVVPALQVAAAQLRARESHRSIVQSAPTGFSALVDAHGRVRAATSLGQPQLLVDEVELYSGQTPYIRWSDQPVLMACLLVVLTAWSRLPRAHNKPDAPNGRHHG